VPPQMRAGQSWYTGTANAIQQNRYLLERNNSQWVLILSGDHIYRMDYAPMIKFHSHHGASATVGCMDVPTEQAREFGVMTVDSDHRITDFTEKPEQPTAIPGHENRSLVSMGIYVFTTETLLQILDDDDRNPNSAHDFGKDILPRLIAERPVYAYPFGGREGRVSIDKYWRDVGTVDAFYEANMDLLHPLPPIDLYQEDWPIRTYSGQHPPARTVPGRSGTEGLCLNSIVASGVVISGGGAEHSILFARVFLDDQSVVDRSILFERVRVGEHARIRNCIIDKDVVVPPNESIGFDHAKDRERFYVTKKGVVVVPKGYRFDGAPS
jgi:glucose-1-phosphate adenylyltransferase